jgi:hypothetical protein
LPFLSLSVHRDDSSNLKRGVGDQPVGSKFVEIDLRERTEDTYMTIDSLLPGIYTCIIQSSSDHLSRDALLPEEDSVQLCSTITVDSILVQPGFNTIVEMCVLVEEVASRYNAGSDRNPCRFPYYGRMQAY